MRILVAIANFGYKNAQHLKRLIAEYRSMPCDADIVILSDTPKNFDSGIDVIVGLPTKDPWSLPFGHRKIFAERIEDYDLFIYSEDDILITWKNIEAFLQLTAVLPENEISGFIIYELDAAGKRWYCGFHGPYHWLPDSLSLVGNLVFAQFSNLHSACYMLTKHQLRLAIRSGGYIVEPHKGRYDLLCSAATDPYTQCGFKKVICISRMSDTQVCHLPNRYVGGLGIGEGDFDRQIAFMLSPEYGKKISQELFVTRKNIDHIRWDNIYYVEPDWDLLSLVPPKARSILSVGCGCASTEAVLVQRGVEVVAIPLDPIMGMLAASKGIRVTEADFGIAFFELDGTKFDCILFLDVLQHLKDPVDILKRASKLLANGGEIIISIPNFNCVKFLKQQFQYSMFKRWNYTEHLINAVTIRLLKRWFKLRGIKLVKTQYVAEDRLLKLAKLSLGFLDGILGKRILAVGRL